MRKLAVSPLKLEAAVTLLTAKIQDLNVVIECKQHDGHSLEVYDLKQKREKYVKSLKRAVEKRWEVELEAVQAAELLKLQLPGYMGVPCADYRVPPSLIKYCKLDYKDEDRSDKEQFE